MRILLTVSFILSAVAGAFAQQASSISGKVLRGGSPETNVTVALTGPNGVSLSTVSDASGQYSFENLAPGRYEVFVPGATVDVTRKVTLASGQTRSIDLDLTIYPSAISERVTVAASESQPIEQVSKTVDLITGQEMRDRADFGLVESLRTIPGFRVQQLGGFGKTASIKTRGLRNQDTAILIDGIRFRDASAIPGDAAPFLSDFTLTSVSKVEVLRGPGSSLYGTNAAGGTVDFQTPRARSGTHGQVGGAFGGLGLGRFRGNVSHGFANGKVGIGGGLSRTVYSEGVDGDDRAANTNLQSRIDASPFQNTWLSGRFFFSKADVKLNSSPDTLGTPPTSNAAIIDARAGTNFASDRNDPDSFQDADFFSGQVAGSHALSNSGRFVIAGHYQAVTTKRDNTNGPLGVGFQSASTSIFEGRIDTANARLTWTPNGNNTLTAGYEFEREDFRNEGRTPSGTGNFFTEVGQTSNTVFVQHLIGLNDERFQLSLGARAQRFSLERPVFSLGNAPYEALTLGDPPNALTFDAASSYFFRSTGTKVRAHIGTGYRVPSLYERFGTFFSSFGTPSFVALGDPFLEPEKTVGFDAGVEHYVANGRVILSATYFYTKLTDIIGFANVAPNIGSTIRTFGGYVNQPGGLSRGGEFSAKFKPSSSTDISSSYTFTNSKQRTPQVIGNSSLKTLGVPDHQFTLVATQRFAKFWVNFDFLATSTYLAPIFSNSSFSTYIYRFNGNRRGDLTAGYTFDLKRPGMNLRVFGTVENVFNQEYFENGFRTAKANARLGVSYSF